MRITLLAWIGCTLFLSGCVANYPKDITVVSINVVDRREQAELPAPPTQGSFKLNDPYRDFLRTLSKAKGQKAIKPEDMVVYFRKQEANQSFKNAKPQKPLFRIEFTSKENLHKYAVSKGFPVSSTQFFCNRSDVSVLLGGPRVFWKGLMIGGIPYNYAMAEEKGKVFTYYAFLNVADDFTGPSSYERFDLRTHPEDICFQLKGGFAGRGFESNVVVIPKVEVIRALKNLPPALRAGAIQ